MAWMRLEVSYIDHPKFLVLSDGAFRLWHEGKSYCEKHLTDGLIPVAAVKSFRHFNERRAAELSTAPKGYDWPLWEPHDIGIKMHDFLDHNDSREKALGRMARKKAENETKRSNQQAYRDRQKAERGRSVPESLPVTLSERSGNENRTVPDRTATTPTSSPSPSPTPTSHQHVLQEQTPLADTRSRRPIFKGRKLVVFEWMLDDLDRLLDPHTEAFDLHAWFFLLDQRCVDTGELPPDRDNGAWLRARTLTEAQRRGLPLRVASVPMMGKQTSRLAAALANIKAANE
jgi:hypothetical protein